MAPRTAYWIVLSVWPAGPHPSVWDFWGFRCSMAWDKTDLVRVMLFSKLTITTKKGSPSESSLMLMGTPSLMATSSPNKKANVELKSTVVASQTFDPRFALHLSTPIDRFALDCIVRNILHDSNQFWRLLVWNGESKGAILGIRGQRVWCWGKGKHRQFHKRSEGRCNDLGCIRRGALKVQGYKRLVVKILRNVIRVESIPLPTRFLAGNQASAPCEQRSPVGLSNISGCMEKAILENSDVGRTGQDGYSANSMDRV